MANIREVFTKNLRQHRQKCGISQTKLAEKVGVSSHHIAMIELGRNFPTSELLERLAKALGVEYYELFIEPHLAINEMQRLRQDIKIDIKQVLEEFFNYKETSLFDGDGNEKKNEKSKKKKP